MVDAKILRLYLVLKEFYGKFSMLEKVAEIV